MAKPSRSALSSGPGGGAGEEDYISKGRFNMDPLPMDVDLTRRVEAVIYYSKVLMLNHTFLHWNPTPWSWILEVQSDLNSVDNECLNNEYGIRPDAAADTNLCEPCLAISACSSATPNEGALWRQRRNGPVLDPRT